MELPYFPAKCLKCGQPVASHGAKCLLCGYNPLRTDLKSFRFDIKYGSIAAILFGLLLFFLFSTLDPTKGYNVENYIWVSTSMVIAGLAGLAHLHKRNNRNS